MPFHTTCTDHPDWLGLGDTTGAIEHLRADHAPGAHLGDDDSPIVFSFVPQTTAQGMPDRRRYRCRRCAVQIDTTDPNPSPYCEDCR